MKKRLKQFMKPWEVTNMNSNSRDKIEKLLKETQELLKFESEEDRTDFLSTATHLDFMFEIQKLLDQEGWSHSKLAELLDVDKSYISQLFTGTKTFNANLVGKLQVLFGKKISLSFTVPYQAVIIDLTAVDSKLLYSKDQLAEDVKDEYKQVIVASNNVIDFSNLDSGLRS